MRPGIPAGRDWDKPPESAPGLPVVYRQPFADMMVEFVRSGIGDLNAFGDVLNARTIQAKVLPVEVIDTFEGISASDRPAEWVYPDL